MPFFEFFKLFWHAFRALFFQQLSFAAARAYRKFLELYNSFQQFFFSTAAFYQTYFFFLNFYFKLASSNSLNLNWQKKHGLPKFIFIH